MYVPTCIVLQKLEDHDFLFFGEGERGEGVNFVIIIKMAKLYAPQIDAK